MSLMKKIVLVLAVASLVAIGGRVFWAYQQVKPDEQQIQNNILVPTITTTFDYADTATNLPEQKNIPKTVNQAPALSMGSFVCGVNTAIDIDGNIYNTVKIGAQCWMKQNMRVGKMLTSENFMPQTSSLIEKWCYRNESVVCNTNGGLYTWAEALQYDPGCNTSNCTPKVNRQGICPTGWHIPTDSEFKLLEISLGMVDNVQHLAYLDQLDVNRIGDAGTDQGFKLMVGGSSGFDALFSGARFDNVSSNTFENFAKGAYFWTSSGHNEDQFRTPPSPFGGGVTNKDVIAVARFLWKERGSVGRSESSKTNGYSVRCLKN